MTKITLKSWIELADFYIRLKIKKNNSNVAKDNGDCFLRMVLPVKKNKSSLAISYGLEQFWNWHNLCKNQPIIKMVMKVTKTGKF